MSEEDTEKVFWPILLVLHLVGSSSGISPSQSCSPLTHRNSLLLFLVQLMAELYCWVLEGWGGLPSKFWQRSVFHWCAPWESNSTVSLTLSYNINVSWLWLWSLVLSWLEHSFQGQPLGGEPAWLTVSAVFALDQYKSDHLWWTCNLLKNVGLLERLVIALSVRGKVTRSVAVERLQVKCWSSVSTKYKASLNRTYVVTKNVSL